MNGLHFKDNFRANNTEPFPSTPATPITETTNQNSATPQPVIINDLAMLIAAVSPQATQLLINMLHLQAEIKHSKQAASLP